MEGSELVAEALGEHVFEYFIRNKRAEWADYKAQVTPFELDRYLGTLWSRDHDTARSSSFPTRPPRCSRRRSISPVTRGRRSRTRRSRRSTSRPTAGRARSSCADDDPEGAFVMCRRCASATRAHAGAPARRRRAARRARAPRRPVRRLLPCAVPPQGARGAAAAPVLAHGPGRTARDRGVRRPRAQPRDVPGLARHRPLDLTYMEYELLKFFATHPGKVFTREQLLSRVWGYEYYGGARTVDVHVRRLRAKLGEEHANLIQTVRSVGYRFGQTRVGHRAVATPPIAVAFRSSAPPRAGVGIVTRGTTRSRRSRPPRRASPRPAARAASRDDR